MLYFMASRRHGTLNRIEVICFYVSGYKDSGSMIILLYCMGSRSSCNKYSDLEVLKDIKSVTLGTV
jgi:hypothetical protein